MLLMDRDKESHTHNPLWPVPANSDNAIDPLGIITARESLKRRVALGLGDVGNIGPGQCWKI